MRPSSLRPTRAPVTTAPPLAPVSQRRLDTFLEAIRPRIEPLIRRHNAYGDLSESFPALLFALATGYGDATARTAAAAAIEEGQSLKEAAGRLGLPLWLRKLPAAALSNPLLPAPREPALTDRLVSLIPTQPAAAAAWLERLLIAHQTGRPELTLWVAQQFRGMKPVAHGAAFLGVLAWAWHSLEPTAGRAADLLTVRWKPTLGAARAAKEASLWRERIALEICLGNGISDTWVPEGSAAGLDFVALRTATDFIAEAQRMDNCLDRYADKLIGRTVRVFSIRRDGRSIADIEIMPHEREPGHPVIAQLRGPHNRRAALEVWRAAYQWLGSQPLRLADRKTAIRIGPAVRQRRQDEIWRGFLAVLPERAAAAFDTAVLARKKKRVTLLSSPPPPAAARAKARARPRP